MAVHGDLETVTLHKDEHNKSVWAGPELAVSGGIVVTVAILQAIAGGQGPENYLVILGFSGWASGQLESELQQNSWLNSACSADLLFHQNSEDKWQMAFDTLGFDINSLSPVSGNA